LINDENEMRKWFLASKHNTVILSDGSRVDLSEHRKTTSNTKGRKWLSIERVIWRCHLSIEETFDL